MAAFAWDDPKTGIRYWGDEGARRMVAHVMGTTSPAADGKGVQRPAVLPPPPVGTYDPAIDYNATAAQTGYQDLQDDSQTAYEQGQEDYGLDLGDLTRGRDRSLADLLTGETRLNQDYGFQTSELGRNYGILGRQQAERAARQGVTSAGLLGKSAQVRAANQGREQGQLDLAHNRGLEDIGTQRTRVGEDFTSGKTRLDLGNARTFGGFGGNTILNPLTGKPQFGTLVTSLTRAGRDNTNFQTASAQQRVFGAQQSGYIAPGVLAPTPAERKKKADAFKKAMGL